MLKFQEAYESCKAKWNSSHEAPFLNENCPYNIYFSVLQQKIVNDDNPHTNGEYDLFEALQPLFKVVVDVGARDDTFFIEKSNPSTSLYLFEPHPEFYKTLVSNIESKNLQNSRQDLKVLNMGLSDKNGTLQYFETAQSFVNRWNEQPSKELSVVRLDSLVDLQNKSEISFIKIDTEGFEIDVLRGSTSLLHKTKLIQFEYGGTYPHRGVLLKDVIRLLQQHNFYYFYYIYKDGLFPMDSQSVLEHEQYCNILATKFLL